MRSLIMLAFLLSPAFVICQDISGLWKGTMLNDSTQQYLDYEIVINKDKGKYTGFSHTWFVINNNRYYGVKKIKAHVAKDGKIIIQDAELIDNNYPAPFKHVPQLNVLDLKKDGEEILLSGPFATRQTREFKELTGQILLKKISTVTQSALQDYLQKNAANLTAVK